jgi:hypothetical protein
MARLVPVDDEPQQSTPNAARLVEAGPRDNWERAGQAVAGAPNLGRQLGLTARVPFDAAAGLVSPVGDALTSAYNMVTGRNVAPASQTYQQWIGSVFPTPETGTEKFSNAVSTGMTGTGLVAGAAKASQPVSAAGREIARLLSSNMGAQVAGSASGAGAADLASQGGADPVTSLALGLAGGMAGSRAWDAGTKAAQRVGGAVRSVTGADTEAVQQRMTGMAKEAGIALEQLPASVRGEFESLVSRSLSSNQPIGEEAARRWLQLQAAGVKEPTRAMVTRNPQDWAEEDRLRKLSGIGTPLQERYDAAGNAIRNAITPEVMPGDAATGNTVKRGLQTVADDLKAARTKAYADARNAPEVKEGVPTEGLRQWLNTTEPRWSVQPEYKAALAELQRLSGDRPSITQGNHEELRKFVNSLAARDGGNAGVISDIKKRIDGSLLEAGKSPVFREAREQNTIYRSTVTDQGIVADLLAKKGPLDQKVWTDDVYKKVMGSGVDQIKQLKNTLVVGGQDKAWGTFRDRALEDLSTTLNQGETTANRAASFIRKFDNNAEQLAVILEPAEFQRVKAARDAAEYTMTATRDAPVNNSNTANQLVEYLRTSLAPLGRGLNTLGMGLPGAVMDAGMGSMAARRQAAEINAAMRPQLIGPGVRAPAAPALTGGLFGPLLGAQPTDDRAR